MINPFGRPSEKGRIKAYCVVADLFNVGDDTWPTEFVMEPREGEFVESSDGRRLKIIRVVHRRGDYEPVIELELGKDMTSVTPTEGGAAPNV
jgi:hypothetical protein